MQEVFFTILNMSISGGLVIAVILIARLLLKRAPKKWSYLLWGAAAFRLCCPVSIKMALSLFRFVPTQAASSGANGIEYIHRAADMSNAAGLETVLSSNAPIQSAMATYAPAQPMATQVPVHEAVNAASVDIAGILGTAATIVWLLGAAALIGYNLFFYINMRRNLATAVRMEGNVFESDRVRSPFILGIFNPRIHIPFGLDEHEKEYVLAHERYHLKRGDHIIKVFSFILLALHWFNPLCWLAFFLSNKDMEMSCDEKVLGENPSIRKQYSTTLLSFAVGRQFPTMTPLAFGESGVRSRIKNAMSYSKPKLFVTVLAVMLCLAVITACVANPTDKDNKPDTTEQTAQASETAEAVGAVGEKPSEAAATQEPVVTEAPVVTEEPVETDTADNGYKLGKLEDYDLSKEDEWIDELYEDGKLHQIVYRFNRDTAEQFSDPLAVYTYENYSIPSKNEVSTFDGGYTLKVTDPSRSPFTEPIDITDGSIFNAFYEIVVSLDFSGKSSTLSENENKAEYILTDSTGKEAVYTIDRLGNVARDDGEYASAPLDKQSTAFFFAVMYTYYPKSYSHLTYDIITESKAVRIVRDGKTTYITGEEDVSRFINAVSEDDDGFGTSYRFNCGAGDHGEKVLEFSIGDYYEGSEMSQNLLVYELYSDGHIACNRQSGFIGGDMYLFYDNLCDSIIGDVYYVSTQAFDVNAILQLAAELEQAE